MATTVRAQPVLAESAQPRRMAKAVGHGIGWLIRIVAAVAGACIGFYLTLTMLLMPWYSTWGATSGEARMALPGDDLVPHARTQVTMGVTINAPPADVWPWIVQMGVDRAGLYTYTWLENGLLGLGVENADRIHPEWQDLGVGDHIWFTPEDYPGEQMGPMVTAIDPNRSLTLCNGDDVANCPSTWQFVLQDRHDGTTRLLFRGRASSDRSLLAQLPDRLMEPGYFAMERKMLLGIKERVEQAGS